MTPRQQYVLSAIIEAYAKTAEPVSSMQLTGKIEVSSATIRAEMAELERLGYIYQPHTSSGRIPTDKGYRLYVNNIEQLQADSRASQAIAKRVASAGEVDRSIKMAVNSLVELTHNMGWAKLSDGLYLQGMASLFAQPELSDSGQAFEVARLVDSLDEWIDEVSHDDNRVTVFIGRENPIGKNSGCSLIIARFASPYSDESYLGMIGPTRQNYPRVIGLMDYTSKMLEEMLA